MRKKLENLVENYTKQFLRLSQILLIREKFRLAHKSLMNPFVSIIVDFRLFLREMLRLQTFAIIANSQNTSKGIDKSLSISNALSLLFSLFKVLLMSNDGALGNYEDFFQSFLLISFKKL